MELLRNTEDLENATVYGYPAKDLIMFAWACREMNVSELDLKKFVGNVSFAFDFVQKEYEKMLNRTLEDVLEDMKINFPEEVSEDDSICSDRRRL